MNALIILLLTMNGSFGLGDFPTVERRISQAPQTKATKSVELTESQAVAVAERFIAINGYTDTAPDKERLSLETIEWESDIDAMLKVRYNTLKPEAFGVRIGRKGAAEGWTVVFEYNSSMPHNTSKNGRAVTMDADGSNMRVEHVDFILSKIGKKL